MTVRPERNTVVRDPDRLGLSASEAADRLGVRQQDVYDLAYRLVIAARKSGGRVIIDYQSLLRYEAEVALGGRTIPGMSPGLRTETIGGDDPAVVTARKHFREASSGWVCNACACLVPELRDTARHLEWHASLRR